ncbi:hypothetical protein FYC51_10430 [Agromyces mariniharenae]|uniref:Alpha/beta hydrolase n=1 Tax=Agromyces mariniharenae TaxID=2604423 RepID=A0A5S4V4E3_9MICO|nr:hypothetical protein FYC51_10430 [Agromyces mariniharenae]
MARRPPGTAEHVAGGHEPHAPLRAGRGPTRCRSAQVPKCPSSQVPKFRSSEVPRLAEGNSPEAQAFEIPVGHSVHAAASDEFIAVLVRWLQG